MSFVIDSSGWIEFFGGLAKADAFAKYIRNENQILVPALVVFEVYRKIKKTLGEEAALGAITQMQKGQIISLDNDLALFAADVSLRHQLPMADAVIYASALVHQAKLVTSDNDFRGLENVILI